MRTDPMQDIFEGAEAVADAIHLAEGCTKALIGLIDQIAGDDADLIQQTAAMIAGAQHFLSQARTQTDRVARLSMGPKGLAPS